MAGKPKVKISKIKFSAGDAFNLEGNDKVILVGPNNGGKSQSLREILQICQTGKMAQMKVIVDLEIDKFGDASDLRSFLEENAELINDFYRYGDWQFPENQIQFWTRPYLMHSLLAGFIRRISADDRLNICKQQNSIAPGDQKSKPQHLLYDDATLMEKISGLFRRAFDKDLMFDFRGGSKLPIHVGDIPKNGIIDRVSDAYVKQVRENPLLDEQGDGMKGYAGILFEAIVANRDVTLIDEPEAFLHPPQMRRLGETLSSEVAGQLIVATHSSDIMRGFLEGTKGHVRILRIRREGDVNIVTEAASDVVRELWEKPELRYSNALEGVFHEQTIICEDDSDCRLFNAVADHLSVGSDHWKDTAYVPTGGKHGVTKVASVLKKVGVPVKAVFDIDFLAEGELVRAVVEAFGAGWSEIEPLWRRIDRAVRHGVPVRTVEEVKQDVIALISDAEEGELPKGDVINAMKQGKPWAEVKKFGSIAIPKGDAQNEFRQLCERLEKIGIFIVQVGEIENFCQDVGSHGPKFVTKLLAEVPLGDERLADLRAFVQRVHTH